MDANTPKTWIDVIYVMAAGVPAAVIAIIGWLSAKKANAKIDTNTEITKQTNEKVNGRMDQLMSASNENAHERGRVQGLIEQQERQTSFAKVIIQQSKERTKKIVQLMNAASGGAIVDVLVVEDSDIDAITLCRTLAKFHMECEVATSAISAKEKLSQKNYCAIFADLDLGCPISMRGTLIKDLMETSPSTPVFVVTGFASKAVIEGMKILGVVATISKSELDETFGKVLSNLGNASI